VGDSSLYYQQTGELLIEGGGDALMHWGQVDVEGGDVRFDHAVGSYATLALFNDLTMKGTLYVRVKGDGTANDYVDVGSHNVTLGDGSSLSVVVDGTLSANQTWTVIAHDGTFSNTWTYVNFGGAALSLDPNDPGKVRS
jgi:hypothetical protein